MQQVVQSYRTGELRLAEAPLPALGPNQLMVQTAYSAVSIGTEGKKVSTARQSLLGKARSRPDLVKQVMQTAQREGITSTYRKVMNRLDEPVSLGYSAAGTIIAMGPQVEGFSIGDRVACGGEGAAHAEVMVVPVSLCATAPDSVSLDHAAFTTVGAIALQGIRQAETRLGDCVAVIGLGLVGQLAVQLLKAHGCRVLGIDLDPNKTKIAAQSGADEAVQRDDPNLEAITARLSRGFGVDAVLITAATSSNDPAQLAVELCRDRGRIVVVGDVNMEFSRNACYLKELDIRLSRSYGPGRYDPIYEEKGIDYPIGQVRWTEQRNMEAFLDLLEMGKLSLGHLITHRFRFDQATHAYDLLSGKSQNKVAPLGVVFEYDTTKSQLAGSHQKLFVSEDRATQATTSAQTGVGFIGAGSFARKYLIPAAANHPMTQLVGLSTATGISGENSARKFSFDYSAGDHADLLQDNAIHALFVATRHNLHAPLVVECLKAGKSVFVEKPLALNQRQLKLVVDAHESLVEANAIQANGDRESPVFVQVGFNRRFAPLTIAAQRHFADRVEPMVVHCRVNAGYVEGDHWTQDFEEGGGRIVGEACHFVDLIGTFVGVPVRSIYATRMNNVNRYHNDNVAISMTFADGSMGNILYLANGDTAMPKERIEIFCQGRSAVLDDFSRLEIFQNGRRTIEKSGQDKGHTAEVNAFLDVVANGGPPPIAFADLVQSTQATLAVLESLQTAQPIFFDGAA